ncbi:MAG: DEAD/DEAH box helicase, partial [Pyrinomonadaceae bacterium]
MNFSQLGLAPAQLQRCESLGYNEPTPIQRQAIPVVLSGSDLIGCAETGTGKTAAFLLPIIQKLAGPARGVITPKGTSRNVARILILAPTRELATQIDKNYRELNSVKSNRSVIVIGGTSIYRQIEDLRRGTTVIIATPGRLLDLIERRVLDLSQVEVLVLDEADRMLDMGFLPAIRRILAMLPAKRQTLLFSATMSPEIEKLARSTMQQPKLVEVSPRGKPAAMVEQTAYPVAQESKTALLLDLLERERFERVLVFTRTRRGAE